jgi:hypothetical protein
MRPSQVHVDRGRLLEKVEYREVQHHHLCVLQLHEEVTVHLMRHLFNPERRIDDRRLSILS